MGAVRNSYAQLCSYFDLIRLPLSLYAPFFPSRLFRDLEDASAGFFYDENESPCFCLELDRMHELKDEMKQILKPNSRHVWKN